MMFWDHKTLIRADLVESIYVWVNPGGENAVYLQTSGAKSVYSKTYYTEREAFVEFRDLHSKWTEAMRDR